jgi:tRNA(Ile)-lysidine synthase TilS/MesJ
VIPSPFCLLTVVRSYAGGILYTVARREKYNVLVLAQHLDDLCESFVMSAFHNGRLRTMKAHYTNGAGDIRIIRPFIYVRERMTREYAESAKLPIIVENCPGRSPYVNVCRVCFACCVVNFRSRFVLKLASKAQKSAIVSRHSLPNRSISSPIF